MLAPDDADVVARHPSLPGLRVALDPAAVTAEVARALPELEVLAAQATYVRFKPPTSFLVGYRLTRCGGTEVDAYVRSASAVDDDKLRKTVATARQRGGEGSAALLEPHIAVLVHPSDHDLPAVARLADPEQRRHVLARALDAPPTDCWRLERLRYKPERRWVAMLTETAGRRLVLKVHRVAQHRAAVAGAAAFARSRVPVSRLVGSSRRHGITIHQWVEGTAASQVLVAGGRDAATVAAAVGTLLARLHAAESPAPPRPLAPQPDERQALAASVGTIAALDPAAGVRAERIAGCLSERLAQAGSRPGARGAAGSVRLLHGDCSIDQVIVGPQGPALIDVDRATTGDPHSDVGQLLADLAIRQVTGALAADDQAAAAFLAGYTAAGGSLDLQHLTALTAARLLRLAPEPFRHRHERWAAQLDAALESAAALARDGLPT